MKIIRCLIFLLFIKVIYGYFYNPYIPLRAENDYYPRFADLISVNNKNDVESDTEKGYNYKLTISLMREVDTSDDKIKDIKTIGIFSKKSINLLKNKKIAKKIPLIDFQFIDGKVLFKNTAEFSEITTQVYKDITSKFQPRIEEFIAKMGQENFNKFCSMAIRKKLKVIGESSKGYSTIFLIFCLNDETPSILIRFREDFINFYTNAILKSEDFLSLQNYTPSQTLQLEFYDPNIEFSGPNPVSVFHLNFNQEGLLISADQSNDFNKLKFSFRFDQIINCRGFQPSICLDIKRMNVVLHMM